MLTKLYYALFLYGSTCQRRPAEGWGYDLYSHVCALCFVNQRVLESDRRYSKMAAKRCLIVSDYKILCKFHTAIYVILLNTYNLVAFVATEGPYERRPQDEYLDLAEGVCVCVCGWCLIERKLLHLFQLNPVKTHTHTHIHVLHPS